MNREKKFTKGPWVSVSTDLKGDRHYGVAKLDDLSCGVALTGYVDGGDDLESRANADLISAAPDLLKNLESHCQACLERNKFENGCQGCFTQRAIAKAYGEDKS